MCKEDSKFGLLSISLLNLMTNKMKMRKKNAHFKLFV